MPQSFLPGLFTNLDQHFPVFGKYKKIIVPFFVSLCLTAIIFWSPLINLTQRLELGSLDYRFQYRGRTTQPSADILLVLLDSETTLKYGFRSPTPRKLLAKLITDLSEKEAKIIGVDFLLDIQLDQEQDQALENALKISKDRVVLISESPSPIKGDFPDKNILPRFRKYAKIGYSSVKMTGDKARGIQVVHSGTN